MRDETDLSSSTFTFYGVCRETRDWRGREEGEVLL